MSLLGCDPAGTESTRSLMGNYRSVLLHSQFICIYASPELKIDKQINKFQIDVEPVGSIQLIRRVTFQQTDQCCYVGTTLRSPHSNKGLITVHYTFAISLASRSAVLGTSIPTLLSRVVVNLSNWISFQLHSIKKDTSLLVLIMTRGVNIASPSRFLIIIK